MAVNKGGLAITQLTASGTSTSLDVSTVGSAVLLIKHSNGTGLVSAPASFQVQVRRAGGTAWYTWAQPSASNAAGQMDDIGVDIPPQAGAVRIVYAAPTGPTGYTCDAEVATETEG